MKKIIRDDLVRAISKQTRLPKTEVDDILGALVMQLRHNFKKGRHVELRNFGTFYPCHYSARKCRIPYNGDVKTVSGSTIMRFKASKKFFVIKDKE